MTKYTFADLDKWGKKVERNLDLLMRQSTSDLLAGIPIRPGIMRGHSRQDGSIPRDVGQLANSLESRLNGRPVLTGASSYALVAGRMAAEDVAEFAWTAAHARVNHDGGNGITGTYWTIRAAKKWKGIVDSNARRIRG